MIGGDHSTLRRNERSNSYSRHSSAYYWSSVYGNHADVDVFAALFTLTRAHVFTCRHSPDFPWVQQQLRLQTPQPSQSYFHWVRWQQRMRLGQPEALAWRAAVEDEIRINNSRLQAQAPSPVSTQAQPSPPVNPAQTPQSAAQTPRFGESNIFTNQSTAQEGKRRDPVSDPNKGCALLSICRTLRPSL